MLYRLKTFRGVKIKISEGDISSCCSAEVCPAEVDIAEIGKSQTCLAEVGIYEVSSVEFGRGEVSIKELRTEGRNINEIGIS